jgi:hypothetical protein
LNAKKGRFRSYPNWTTVSSRGQVELWLKGQAKTCEVTHWKLTNCWQPLATVKAKQFEDLKKLTKFLCG